ncbi:MAG: type II toxin-antitoxin system mRNA interferase toxin, RelE/StbE family [bacterium]|nr:type II toxin-antitoxin system mRNA interferase toxin, RelE/StbE family [bacterium]
MRIELHRNFLKSYVKLPRKIQEKFKERRNLFIENMFHPTLDNHSVEPTYPNCRSINITGDYRALFEIRGKDMVVFTKIGTHSELY